MSGALDPAGPVAERMADLWWQMLVLGTVSFLAFMVLLVLALRRRAPLDEEPSRAWIIGGGVIQPLVLVIIVFGLTLVAMRALPDEGDPDALVIEVVGHQWWYEVSYPDLGVEIVDEIHLPVGRPVELQLRSADVIHSFWIPELGGKTDMLPDGVNVMVLQADRVGRFTGSCAEFCGLDHTLMQIEAVSHTPADFDRWVADQQGGA
jgi:cytochrome c oxidase subunit 2